MREKIIRELEACGIKAEVVSTLHLDDLHNHIEGFYKEGLFDEDFYKEYLAGFIFIPPTEMPEAKSLIIASAPDPQIRIVFEWNGEQLPVLVPPTYLHWRKKDAWVEEKLSEVSSSAGCRIAPARVPKKLLAVCSGLAEYGRNNITYVEGMGSFHRLTAYYSDLECDQDYWREPVMMDLCQKCEACRRGCPTGAIGTDRFLLRAEKCITYWNEMSGDVDFPEWIQPEWHNSLVGCMLCQRVCPENREVRDWIEDGEHFSEEETRLLLSGEPVEKLPDELTAKLERGDLLEWFDLWPRNLSAQLISRE